MSEDDMYTKHPDPKREARIVQLLRHMELQLRMMETVRNEVGTFIEEEKKLHPACVYENRSTYNAGGYMADYVMDEGGELLDVNYDWVHCD